MGYVDMSQEMSEELKRNLRQYEESKAEGKPIYFDSEDYIDIIHYYMDESDYEKALDAVWDALCIHPDMDPFFLLKIVILTERNEMAEAWRELDRIEDKESAAFKLSKAAILMYEDDRDQAIEVLDTISIEELRTEDEMYTIFLIELYSDMGVVQKAVDYFLKASEWHDLPVGLLEILTQFRVEEDELESAYKLYNILLDHDPYSDDYWKRLAVIAYELGKYEETVDACDFALTIKEDVEVRCLKSNALLLLKNYEKAIEELDACREENGIPHGVYLTFKGLCYAFMGELETASYYFQDALDALDEKSLHYPQLLINSFQCFFALESMYNLSRVYRLLLRSPGIKDAYLLCGVYHLFAGRKRKAVKFWNKAARLFPDVSTYGRIGQTCIDFKEYKLAEYYLKKAEGIDPKYYNINRNLMIMYYQLNDREMCWRYVERAIVEYANGTPASSDELFEDIMEELNTACKK